MPQIQTPLVGNTSIFDVTALRNIDVNSQDFKEFLVKLYQEVNNHSIMINQKDHGIYSRQAYGCCKQLLPTIQGNKYRGLARVVIPWSFDPAFTPGTQTIPHNITFNADTRVFYLYCILNDTIAQTAIPIPYVDVTGAGAANAQINMDATNVYITTAANFSTFDDNYIVIEYTT